MNEQLKPVHTGETALKWQDFRPSQLVYLLDMLRHFADEFYLLAKYATETKHFYNKPVSELSDSDVESISAEFKNLSEICAKLGLTVSYRQLSRIKGALDRRADSDFTPLWPRLIEEFEARLYDELSSVVFMAIPGNKLSYYEEANLFGESVASAFPAASFDIEESGKCFALGRWTACVMHLQRVLEVGLKAYGLYLGISSLVNQAQPNWNRILDESRKEVKERNDKNVPTKVWASKEEKDFCEDVQPFLEAVKTAWRNPSMHADKVYSEEIAEDIYSSVKRFMKHLGRHLNESGVFTV